MSSSSGVAQCILELPVEVSKVFSIDSYYHKSNVSSPSVLVHKHGVSVIESETGAIQQSFDLNTAQQQQLQGCTVVDCIYLHKNR
jgi:hypothetical protein